MSTNRYKILEKASGDVTYTSERCEARLSIKGCCCYYILNLYDGGTETVFGGVYLLKQGAHYQICDTCCNIVVIAFIQSHKIRSVSDSLIIYKNKGVSEFFQFVDTILCIPRF